MKIESVLCKEAQATINGLRQRLIELISAKRPGDYTSKNLPELYALAVKHCPRLHQDVTLCQLHMELGRIRSEKSEAGVFVFYGINAWMEAGMSPIIYFSGHPDDSYVSPAFLERLYAAGQLTPDRETLLGNLSLEQFSHFLADRVSLRWMRYRWLCKVLRTMPELIGPANWHNLSHGHIRVHPEVRKRQIKLKASLKAMVPLLLVESGQSDALYQQAKNELGLHDPLVMENATRNAFSAHGEHAEAVLERFIQLEYGGWNTPLLDKVLTPYLQHYNFETRHDYFHLDERIWFLKAVETLGKPDRAAVTWPAALYGNLLHQGVLTDEHRGLGKFRWKVLLKMVPELQVIQDYVTRVDSPLIAVLKDTQECSLLVHPIWLSQFSDPIKAAYALAVAPCVARYMMKDMSYGVFERFDSPQATERTLQRCDPDCVSAMSEWAKQSKDIRELNCRLQGHLSILWLMIRNLRGEHNKDQAIAWCTRLRSQRTKFEAMRLLDLTLDDVKLTPSLHDEFLTRDLGL